MPESKRQDLKEHDELPVQRRNARITVIRRRRAKKATGDSLADGKGKKGQEVGQGDDPEDPDDGDGMEEVYDVSLSSEEPVDRWFGREVLAHDPENVNLERCQNGMPLLANHDDQRALPIGRLNNVRCENRKLNAEMRFFDTSAGRDAKAVVDGGHREMSLGYGIDEYEVTPAKADEPSEYRATRWTPMEGSLVSVPADHTIGVGRSADLRKFPVHVRHRSQQAPASGAATTEVRVMPEAAAPTTGPDQKTAAEIVRRGKLHGCEDKVPEWLERGLTLDQVNEAILQIRATPPARQPASEQLDLTPKEQRQYSYSRAILAAADAAVGGRVEKTFELEISDELEKRMPAEYRRRGGLFVPTTLRGTKFKGDERFTPATRKLSRQQADAVDKMLRAGTIDSQTANAIKEVVFTEYGGELIEILRNQALVVAMGARVLTGLSSPIAFPRQTGDVTATWVAENSGTNVASSNPTTDLVVLSPRTLQAATAYSRQLLVQSSVDVEAMVRQSIAAKHALAWDLAAIHGTGTNSQPLGIYNQPGVLTVDFSNASYSNTGQKIAWTGVVQMENQVASNNALLGDLGFLTTPSIAADAKVTLKFPAVNGSREIWDGSILEGQMDGYEARATNQVSKLLGTNGVTTPPGSFHGLIYGNWTDLLIGQFGGAMEMIVDPYSLKKQGLIEVASFQMADIAVRHPVSFCVGINLNA